MNYLITNKTTGEVIGNAFDLGRAHDLLRKVREGEHMTKMYRPDHVIAEWYIVEEEET